MRLFSLLIWVVFLPVSSGSAQAANLRAAMFDLAPWAMSDGTKSRGIIPLIVDEMEHELGTTITTTVVPYPRMIKMLEAGDVDFAIFFQSGMSREIADPLHVFYLIRTSIIVPSDTSDPALGSKMRIASARGVVFDDGFDTSDRFVKIFSNHHEHSVQLLVQGRVDGIAGPEQQLLGLLNQARPGTPFRVLRVINTNRVTLQYSKQSKHPEMRDAVQKAAEAVRQNGTLDRLLEMFPYTRAQSGQP